MAKYHQELLECIMDFDSTYGVIPGLIKIRKDIFDIIERELESCELQNKDRLIENETFFGIRLEIVNDLNDQKLWCLITSPEDYLIIGNFIMVSKNDPEKSATDITTTMIQPGLVDSITEMLKKNMENQDNKCQKKP